MLRLRRVREAASAMFTPSNTSVWVLLGGGAPFLLPLLRLFAHRFPDKPLVLALGP